MDLSYLGPSAAVVIVVGLFLKFLTDDRKASVERYEAESRVREVQHEQTILALSKVAEATDKNTRMTDKAIGIQKEAMAQQKETTAYLKHRNGSFERLIKEQPYIHQMVKEHFDGEFDKE